MPHIDVSRSFEVHDTFRTAQVIGTFDIKPEHYAKTIHADIPLEDCEWNIGLIVGASGTGKTTIASELAGKPLDGFVSKGGSVVDDMPSGASFNDISKAFTSVGFSSPPSWLKPYSVLSNGEKMRVRLAYSLLDDEPIKIFDEFTSVVDRDVARTASMAISKAVRRAGVKFIAVSCHRDVIDWLEPDWIFDTDEMRFFTGGGGTAQNCVSIYTNWRKNKAKRCGTRFASIII